MSVVSTMRWRLAPVGLRRHRPVLELQYKDNVSAVQAVLIDGKACDLGYIRRLRDGGTVDISFSHKGTSHRLVLHRSLSLTRTGAEYESFDGQRLERFEGFQ